VDQATVEAKKLRDALDGRAEHFNALDRDTLERVAQTIAKIREGLGLRANQSLPICTLRGGFADDREWTYDPAAPAIVVCTVDLGGSRLLFSGYRLSRWSRSMQAGLIGVDSLIVLDEAHIAPAFDEAVRRVRDLSNEMSEGSIPPMRFLPLSATLVDAKNANAFRLQVSDYDDPMISQRTGRSRPTKLIEFRALSQGKDAIVDALAKHAARFDGDAKAVAVFCHSRDHANKIAGALRKRLAESRGTKGKEGHDDNDIALITGARRGYERDTLIEKETYRTFTYKEGQRDLPPDGRTRFLVCTAAGEVGADLDADAAVTDLVPLERMIQRLGRVNRRGERSEPASVTIYYDPSALKASSSEKNEKKAETARLAAATKAALESLPRSGDGRYDASPFHVGKIGKDERKAASTPPPKIVPIERGHVEAWALTSLKEHPGRPEVEPFLHGDVEDDEPQTTVAWRADVACLAELPDRKVEEAIEAARLMPAEVLEAPTREVAELLQKRIKVLSASWKKARNEAENADGSLRHRLLLFKFGKLIGRGEITADKAILRMHLASTGRKKKSEEIALDGDVKDIQRAIGNATVLLEPRLGGLSADGALKGECDEREGEMHVRPDVVFLRIRQGDADDTRWVERLGAPEQYGTVLPKHDELEPYTRLLHKLGLRRIWSAELPGPVEDEDGPTLEYWKKRWDMDGETGASSREQSLTEHLAWAKDEMECLVKRLAVPGPLADALIRAMSIHDTGKDRAEWQDGAGAPRGGRPYAKTVGRGKGAGGYRHEFGSLRDALDRNKNTVALDGLGDDLRDLALHLIASHHGRARPTIPAQDEEELFPAVLERDALDAALRYIRLQRRWGPWALAWLEALFRSVDATVSRRLEKGDEAAAPAKEAAE
jgi:CRISPR-associated endonuclease/helicase Cas3